MEEIFTELAVNPLGGFGTVVLAVKMAGGVVLAKAVCENVEK